MTNTFKAILGTVLALVTASVGWSQTSQGRISGRVSDQSGAIVSGAKVTILNTETGVQRTPGGGFHSVTSNGSRLEDMNYIVDGVDDNDAYYGDTVINGAGVLGTPASHLPLDAIQEFNSEENQSAEFGWKPGAVVNIGVRSGTNQFHGTAYYFNRNSALDARNYFNPRPQPFSPLLLHEFGASAGGPIIKDKLFIFGNYEGVRHKVGNPGNV